jgi:hypothetical protein
MIGFIVSRREGASQTTGVERPNLNIHTKFHDAPSEGTMPSGRIRHHALPEKWTRFSDKDMLQVFELARILFDQVIPPDRKAR